MASHLDLQEQEQIAQFKHFWQRFGTPIISALTLVFLAYGGWHAWQLHGVDQSNKAASLYDELEQAAQASNLEKINQAFENLKLHYPKTIWAQQAALVAAKNQAEKGQVEAGLSSLRWVSAQATEPMYAWIARLRMTGLLIDSQQWDAALRELEGAAPPSLEGLIADRRGDILNLQGHREEAISAYQKAWKILDATSEYRQLVEAKLLALGSDTGVSK